MILILCQTRTVKRVQYGHFAYAQPENFFGNIEGSYSFKFFLYVLFLWIQLNSQVILSNSHNTYNVKCDQSCIEHSQCLNLKQQISQYFTSKSTIR